MNQNNKLLTMNYEIWIMNFSLYELWIYVTMNYETVN